MKKCPVCGNSVKVENLEEHLKKTHPKSKVNPRLTLTAAEMKAVTGSRTKRRTLSTGGRVAIVVGVILIATSIVAYALVSAAPKPKLFASHAYYDFGQVGQSKYSHTFTIGNTGPGDLVVNRIWSSCGCTSAKLVVNGVESPEFGMPGHGGATGPWQATLKPGETANLVVYYDSTEMPDLYQGERYVFMDSNDPSNPEFQFTILVQEIR